MAIRFSGAISDYVGLSTDTKPLLQDDGNSYRRAPGSSSRTQGRITALTAPPGARLGESLC